MENKTAVVVLSGGQDSTTCLGVAQQRFGHGNLHCVAFDYGQRHVIELRCAEEIAREANASFNCFEIPVLGEVSRSALLERDSDIGAKHTDKPNLPASFVPNRNALFLTIAHAFAQKVGATAIYTGVCETDYSGYPDCRQEFIRALQRALNLGYEVDVDIVTPLMHLTKAQTFQLAWNTGVLELVMRHSHTCYNGDHRTPQLSGYGCGECPACVLREKGYRQFLLEGTPEAVETARELQPLQG